MEINRYNKKLQRDGYWEQELFNTISKGNYYDGWKDGIWKDYWKGNLHEKVLFNKGISTYLIAYRSNYINYINFKPKYKEIHIEEL